MIHKTNIKGVSIEQKGEQCWLRSNGGRLSTEQVSIMLKTMIQLQDAEILSSSNSGFRVARKLSNIERKKIKLGECKVSGY